MLTPETVYDRVIVEMENNQSKTVRIEAREVAKDAEGVVRFESPLPTVLDDVTGVHAQSALGVVAGGLAVELEKVKAERDRLRIIVDAFPQAEPPATPPASAAEPDPQV